MHIHVAPEPGTDIVVMTATCCEGEHEVQGRWNPTELSKFIDDLTLVLGRVTGEEE